MSGEGNLGGFVGRGERGAESLIASSSEISVYKNLSRADKPDIIFELSAFFDGGIFWDRESYRTFDGRMRLNDYFSKRTLADAGLGIRLNTSLLEKDVFIRIDLPFYIFDGNDSKINFNNWVFSFQRSI